MITADKLTADKPKTQNQLRKDSARGCDYKTAQYIVYHIFKDYYKVDLEAVENPVDEEASCLLIYRVRFFTGERGALRWRWTYRAPASCSA